MGINKVRVPRNAATPREKKVLVLYGVVLDGLTVVRETHPHSTTVPDPAWEKSPGIRVAQCSKLVLGECPPSSPMEWSQADSARYTAERIGGEWGIIVGGVVTQLTREKSDPVAAAPDHVAASDPERVMRGEHQVENLLRELGELSESPCRDAAIQIAQWILGDDSFGIGDVLASIAASDDAAPVMSEAETLFATILHDTRPAFVRAIREEIAARYPDPFDGEDPEIDPLS
jgi:hypothetical protein